MQPIPPESAARRGRPKKPHIELDPDAIARQIRGLHGFAALITKLPELNLSEAESVELAKASVNFSREFGYEPDPKLFAALELIGVAGFIYVPRALAVIERLRTAKQQRGQTIDGQAETVATSDGHATVN
ncbi:MAG: hypothetical protein ACP5QA_10435 [Phycisphaerae bacterium]